ncbi:uncharacterized protein LOC108046212 [Drosophila rhopaloa]|uniref:Uncharacterized protein LOC108046212 n=1 Tax=Drosophila rhopaloa TaxID=1041015 RepID=A0A6P4EX20_DRORH|nr:uncharacterized protein LOC108046212 [Drosophila rhopaloa]
MKSALCVSLVLLLLGFASAYSSGSSSGSSSPKVCVLKNCDWYSTTNACGKFGRSNLCNRFKNSCALRYENCVGSTTYTAVSLSQCSGISEGSRGTCGGSSSSSSSSSNVKPIIIRRG